MELGFGLTAEIGPFSQVLVLVLLVFFIRKQNRATSAEQNDENPVYGMYNSLLMANILIMKQLKCRMI